MFTINIYLKFALIALCLFGGTALWIAYGAGYGWLPILIGILLLLSYFLLGTVQSASVMLQDMDFVGAEKRLKLTFFPKLLYVTNRAFYNIIKGTLSAQDGDQKIAEEYFNSALNMKLPSDNERAMVLLQMASLNANKNKWTAAKNYFKQAKKLNVTQSQIKEQLEMMEKAMAQQGQMKAARSMGKQGMQMMNRGGKRRRPKMR